MSDTGRRAALVGVVALLLGLTLGFVLGQVMAGPDENTEQLRKPLAEEPSASAARDGDKDGSAARPREPIAPRTEPTAVEPDAVKPQAPASAPPESMAGLSIRERLERALADLPPIERETGTGQITGIITDKDTGAPVAGVLVEAWGQVEGNEVVRHIRQPEVVEPWRVESLAERGSRTIASSLGSAQRYYHTVSGADGRYVLDGLPDRTFSVSARAADYEITAAGSRPGMRGQVENVKVGNEVNFDAKRRWMVPIEIYNPDGSPAAGMGYDRGTLPAGLNKADAQAAAEAMTNFSHSSSWGGPGDFVYLPAGAYAFRCKPSATAGLVASDPVAVTVGDGGDNRAVIRLRAVAGFLVTVRDESDEGDSEASFYVKAMPWDGSEAPTGRAFDEYERRVGGRESKTFAEVYGRPSDGSARALTLAGLNPGRYVVAIVRTYDVIAHEFVQLDTAPVEVKLVIPPTPRDRYILVWVQDPEGKPIMKDVRFNMSVSSSGGSSTGGGNARHVGNGAYRISHRPPSGDLASRSDTVWSVFISHQTYGSKTVTYTPGPATEFTVKFDQPAKLVIGVDGFDNHPAKEFLAAVVGEPALPDSRRSDYGERATATAGGFTVLNRQPGEVVVRLMIRPSGDAQVELSQQRMSLSAGTNHVRFSLPPLHAVTISVPQSEPGVNVSIRRVVEGESGPRRRFIDSGESVYISTNSDRVARLDFLPSGKYSLSCYDSTGKRYDQTEFSLPGAATITLLPK